MQTEMAKKWKMTWISLAFGLHSPPFERIEGVLIFYCSTCSKQIQATKHVVASLARGTQKETQNRIPNFGKT